MMRTVAVPAADIPVIREVDVLVCGGGPAGTAAAVSAARMGARTLLLERYNHLGGLATGGQVILIPHFVDSGRQIIGGLGIEIRDRLLASGEAAYDDEVTSAWHFDPEAMKSLSVDLLREAGAGILLHSWCADAVVDDGRLVAVVTASKAGRQAVMASVVVDATGDFDIGALAGAGSEKSDAGVGVCFRIGGVDLAKWGRAQREQPEVVQQAQHRLREAGGWEGFIGLTAVPTAATQAGVVWANNEVRRRADGLDPAVLTAIELEGREMARRGIEVLRSEMPGYEGCWLIDVAAQTGVRYTRRMVGEYTMTADDVSQFDFRHPDSVARGNDFRCQGRAYDIPRGALVSRDVPNLLAAGRCLSCEHVALEPIREIHVCWASGQAAGVIAALAAREGRLPAGVGIETAQAALQAQGAIIGGLEG